MSERKHEPERSPKSSEEQEYPEPERPLNVQEEAGQDPPELDHPSQAEGERDAG